MDFKPHPQINNISENFLVYILSDDEVESNLISKEDSMP